VRAYVAPFRGRPPPASCRHRWKPDIPGVDSFTGTSLFTSRWPRGDVDLRGKRVGVIGTGSTGVQLIPVIAPDVDELVVFQRSPATRCPGRCRALEPGELERDGRDATAKIREAQRSIRWVRHG